MSIAISEDHQALADTAHDFLGKHGALGAARALLAASDEALPEFWSELASLGWLGLHIPEEHGGSGFGLPELVIVVEELGRAIAPGPFVPTVAASAIIAACGSDELKAELLPGLADGSLVGAVALSTSLDVNGGKAFGSAGTVVSGALADVIVAVSGADVVVARVGAEVEATVPANIDPTRRAARITLRDAPVTVLAGCAGAAIDLARTIFSAEAVGVARECTNLAAEYAKVREQFGRPIAMFQAVKHHCANMLVATELATSSVWDAARAATTGGDEFSFAAAVAATHALPAADLCANLNTQVHGGIGMTWEHDCHLFVRRAVALQAVVNADDAATAVTDLTRAGASRENRFELPPEADPIRETVKAFVEQYQALDTAGRAALLLDTGYAMPHWPAPWGRDAKPLEQLVIEQEFKAAGVQRPSLGITGWVILTLIQHATEDQVARWVRPALSGEVIWCQLFSEPDAGSDAAGVKTKATRVDGGWLVNGQKVWTTGAQHSSFGLATVRTDPDAPKHNGITTMVIDMKAEGVEIRPLRLSIGAAEFNEIFFTDVFVPDDDVVGPIDGGWTVARATLGNESVSIGGGQGGGMNIAPKPLVALFDAHPDRLPGGEARIGRYISIEQAQKLLNLRSIERAVSGAGPGAEGAVTKLVLSENGHEAAAMTKDLAGPDAAFMDGEGATAGMLNLMHRVMSIAGGTSEIKRNQIGERLLGLPRDPLVK